MFEFSSFRDVYSVMTVIKTLLFLILHEFYPPLIQDMPWHL